jgi:hypothetical protein
MTSNLAVYADGQATSSPWGQVSGFTSARPHLAGGITITNRDMLFRDSNIQSAQTKGDVVGIPVTLMFKYSGESNQYLYHSLSPFSGLSFTLQTGVLSSGALMTGASEEPEKKMGHLIASEPILVLVIIFVALALAGAVALVIPVMAPVAIVFFLGSAAVIMRSISMSKNAPRR